MRGSTLLRIKPRPAAFRQVILRLRAGYGSKALSLFVFLNAEISADSTRTFRQVRSRLQLTGAFPPRVLGQLPPREHAWTLLTVVFSGQYDHVAYFSRSMPLTFWLIITLYLTCDFPFAQQAFRLDPVKSGASESPVCRAALRSADLRLQPVDDAVLAKQVNRLVQIPAMHLSGQSYADRHE